MAVFPKGVPYRKTKHKKPRHQLYIPGFNPANSCWLDGDWVNVSEEEWNARKADHKRMFGRLSKLSGKQHHRDPETPLDKMTDAQRRAYDHYSGHLHAHVLHGDETVPAGLEMAGNGPGATTLKWMRDNDLNVIPRTVNGHTGEVTDVLEGLDFPDDVVSEDTEPVDPWVAIVEGNRRKEMAMFDAYIKAASSPPDEQPGGMKAMAIRMAMTSLTMKEESIIRAEWNAQRGENEPYDDINREINEYVDMRQKLVDVFGEAFEPLYDSSRASHNSCARTNLDNSDGVLFSYVLPKFNEDGTHEPWGKRDVPWGNV